MSVCVSGPRTGEPSLKPRYITRTTRTHSEFRIGQRRVIVVDMPMDLDLRMVTADMRSRVPRVFFLLRHVDVSGVTGTGIVAEGTEWTDGSVSLRWRHEHASTTFYEAGVRAVLAVHGHRGASEVIYLSPSDGLAPVGSSPDLVSSSQRAGVPVPAPAPARCSNGPQERSTCDADEPAHQDVSNK